MPRGRIQSLAGSCCLCRMQLQTPACLPRQMQPLSRPFLLRQPRCLHVSCSFSIEAQPLSRADFCICNRMLFVQLPGPVSSEPDHKGIFAGPYGSFHDCVVQCHLQCTLQESKKWDCIGCVHAGPISCGIECCPTGVVTTQHQATDHSRQTVLTAEFSYTGSKESKSAAAA